MALALLKSILALVGTAVLLLQVSVSSPVVRVPVGACGCFQMTEVWCLPCTIALATTCFACDVVPNLPNKKGIKEPNPGPSRLKACAKIVGIYLSKT